MRIALIGATGYVGAAILAEALDRGHQVTAIVQHPEKLPRHKNLTGAKGDAYSPIALGRLMAGHDAVISAFSPGAANPDAYALQVKGTETIIAGVKISGLKRLLMVGGAGSLEVAPGIQLVDTPDFPKEWKAGAMGTRDAFNILKKEDDLEWTFFSPAALLQPGERTGVFRLGTDQPVLDAKGECRISTQDYAVAMIDELETPAHVRQRFTIGY